RWKCAVCLAWVAARAERQHGTGADRDKLDPILDACVAEYIDNLSEDDQVAFKGKAKAFVRSYGFLAAILTYGHPAWEKLAIREPVKRIVNFRASNKLQIKICSFD
uniref:hypothetical protein n=1 Tax=Burkholderia sp. BCC1998 TaxID=2817447 RepID=UPI002AB6126D